MSRVIPLSRPVVFLHGWTMRGSIFDNLIAKMPKRFHCHAPDLPGHGSLRTVDPTLGTAAETLSELLETRDIRDAVLVGWSMGAAVAWEYIERFGADRISGLMSVDMSPKLACEPNWPHGLIGQNQDDVNATTQRMVSDWLGLAEAAATTMFARREGAEVYSRQEALLQINANDSDKMIAMWKALVDMDKRDIVRKLPCPLLASCGVLSRVYPQSAAQWLASTAPQGEVHVFETSGHSPHLEEPTAFANRLVKFANSL